MEFTKYIENMRRHHLTLEDLEKLEIGETLDVVVFSGPVKKITCDATDFFKNCRFTLTYKGNMVWDMLNVETNESFPNFVHFCTRSLNTNWAWYPVNKDGYIYINTEPLSLGDVKISDSMKFINPFPPIHLHYKQFPKNTRVGFKAPIMLWSHLKPAPLILYTGENSRFE